MVIKVAPIVEGIDDTSNNNDTISKKKGKPKVAAMMNIRLANSTPTRRSMAIIYKKSNPNSPKEAGRKLAVEGRTRASNLYSDSDDDSSTTPVIKKRDISTRKRLETLSNHPERPVSTTCCL